MAIADDIVHLEGTSTGLHFDLVALGKRGLSWLVAAQRLTPLGPSLSGYYNLGANMLL